MVDIGADPIDLYIKRKQFQVEEQRLNIVRTELQIAELFNQIEGKKKDIKAMQDDIEVNKKKELDQLFEEKTKREKGEQ